MTEKKRTYIAIDLKSFYASVECKERNRDPLTTNLVVADKSSAMRYALSFCYHRESIFLSSLISAWFSSNTSLYWRPPK